MANLGAHEGAIDETRSLAIRENNQIKIKLVIRPGIELTGLAATQNQVWFRFSKNRKHHKALAEVDRNGKTLQFHTKIKRGTLNNGTWQLSWASEKDGTYSPMPARIHFAVGQPATLLLGPLPKTEMGLPENETKIPGAPPTAAGKWRIAQPVLLSSAAKEVLIISDAAHVGLIDEWLLGEDWGKTTLLLVADSADTKTRLNLDDKILVSSAKEVAAKLTQFKVTDVVLCLANHKALGFNNARRLLQACLPLVKNTGAVILTSEPEYQTDPINTLIEIKRGLVPARTSRELTRISRTLASVRTVGDSIVVEKKHNHYFGLRHENTVDLLPIREPGAAVRVIANKPACSYPAAAVASTPADPFELPQTINVPELTLKHYTGSIRVEKQQVVSIGRTILADSFYWSQLPKHVHPVLDYYDQNYLMKNWVPREKPSFIAGDFYYADNASINHFGHLTTEVFSKLWGWDQAKAEFPGLKLLVARTPNRPQTLPKEILKVLGYKPEDIVFFDTPSMVSSLVAATPMWHNAPDFFAHPDMKEIWAKFSHQLLKAENKPVPAKKIFVSRTPSNNRTCENSYAVDELFRQNGFEVVFPQVMSLAAQAAKFAEAEVVAGFGGSGMFNLMHCQKLQQVIVLNHDGYDARNEFLYASLLGVPIHHFWSNPDLDQSSHSGETLRQSTWTFDLAENHSILVELLKNL